MKSIFEEMGGTYRQERDYLIPNIKLPEQEEYQLGKYGRMRRNFLKEHHPARYSDLIEWKDGSGITWPRSTSSAMPAWK